MTRGDDAAFIETAGREGTSEPLFKTGLTKREWFAGLAMQGVISSDSAQKDLQRISDEKGIGGDVLIGQVAVRIADALIAALNAGGDKGEE